MIHTIFQLCVALLVWLADLLGISYEAVNVWIFCVLWPLFTVFLICLALWQRRTISRLRRLVGDSRAWE
jgi:hypothetical protein